MDTTDPPETDLDFTIYLDRKDTAVPDGNLQFTITDWLIDEDDLVVVQSTDCDYPGLSVQIDSVVAGLVTLKDDPNGTVIYGSKYTSRYRPTMPLVKDQNGVVIGTNSLTINNFNISFKDTGAFDVVVIDEYNENSTQSFTGRIVGGINNLVGEMHLVTGTFNAGIGKNRDYAEVEITTDKYLPMSLVDIEWTGQFTKTGRRI